jgi:serine O-acetyltransferase
VFDILRADFKRYILSPNDKTTGHVLAVLFYEESLWFIIALRFGQWVRQDVHVPILRELLMVLSRVIHRLMSLITGIQIDIQVKVGPGLYVGHGGKLVVHHDVNIGSNCNLSTGVVVGIAGRGEKRGVPTIGNRVFIAPGAKVIGKVVIGDDVAIGANAVVTKDVPANAVVAGIPARIVSYEGSKDFIQMYSDLDK